MSWTAKDDRFIRMRWNVMSPAEIARQLHRRTAHVCQRGRHLGLEPKQHHWTPDEDDVLREHYQTTPVRALAVRLGRTMREVERRADRLGLLVKAGGGHHRPGHEWRKCRPAR